jgi:surface protein
MNHFINQSNGSHRGHSLMERAMIRRFALFPMMLLMLLFLPAGMVAKTAASSSKYIATYDSDTETLTFEKYEGESLPSDSESEWVEDGKSVFEMFGSSYLRDIKHIVINESFKTFTPTTLSCFFAALSELETITGLEYLNTANVTDMSFLFDHCQKLTSLDLSNFNTAKVTNMNKMFSNCSNLKTIYASDKFTTAAVTESKNMFSYCGSLSGDIDWTSDKATDKTYAKTGGGYFRDKAYDNRPYVKYADGTLTFRCGYKKILGENEYELNSDEELPAWNTHKNKITRVVFEASFANARPTTCYAWFKNFSELMKIEGIENLNTENVTSMAYMFSSCNKLAELDVTHFNTANVKNMEYMFECCKGLSSLDVTNFNTANVTNMLAMFGRTSLTSLDVTNFNTANVTSMRDMFCNCDKLTSLDVTNFNTAKVTDMGYMFCRCHNLTEIYVSDKFVTDAVTNSYQMFAYCESLSGDIDWSDKAVDKTYAKTDGGYFRDKAYDNRPWVKFADGTLAFRCGYKKTLGENEYELNSGEKLPKWYTHDTEISKVVFEASFANARPTNCYAWFVNFKNLTQIEGIENLNTENVTSMRNMFCGCSKLTSLDVTKFNTEKVTDMSYMFYNCKALTSLDVTNFNSENVTNMSFMFSRCSTLTTIYVNDKFVIDKVTNGYCMFDNCTNLKDYAPSKKNHNYANYKTGYFTKLVGKNGDEKIGAAGKTLTTDNLVLDDGKDFVAYEPFTAKAASYSRPVKAGTTWATLCLPFEVSLADKNFRAFKLLSAEEGTETVELEEIKTSIEAGTPVIIKMKDGATKLNFTVADKEIAKDVQTAETANGNYQLQGLYTQKEFSKDADNNCYIVKGSKLMNPAKLLDKTTTESVGSKPFRAYMVDNSSAPAAGARMFSISVGGSTTAIEQLESTADSKAEYYDLQGRRLQNLQKGVNIVKRGGKTMKVIIK